MQHDFSVHFLRIMPPDTNFGEAWESLCYILLCEEMKGDNILRLGSPDKGVDILHNTYKKAYQCKSHESGASGTIPPSNSMTSLKTAHKNMKSLGWDKYIFATNANYSGDGITKIKEIATSLGLDNGQIDFMGPEQWDRLCTKHSKQVEDRFYYRVTATEKQIIDAFKSARYLDSIIPEFEQQIQQANFPIVLTNNLTPIQIEIPFAPELTVENYLDVAKQLLGISLDWTVFNDLNTTAGPSLSITIEQRSQPFSKKIADLSIKPGDKLNLWITVSWRDQRDKPSKQDGQKDKIQFLKYDIDFEHRLLLNIGTAFEDYQPDVNINRGQLTFEREREILQNSLWKGVHQFIRGNSAI